MTEITEREPTNPATIYTELNPHVEQLRVANITQLYHTALRAALIKNFEFNVFIWNAPAPNLFFSIATLRGLCEDLIALKYLANFDEVDRENMLRQKMRINIDESLRKQEQFFTAYRPSQPVLPPLPVTGPSIQDELTALCRKYNWKRTRDMWPSTWEMANACGLQSLYEYLYAASSEWVHFNPRLLFRMGWSKTKEKLDSYTFSTENFNIYYTDFIRFYGTYIFIEFHDAFKNLLSIQPDLSLLVDDLRTYIDEQVRWPELVTFEEMNLPEPGTLRRVFSFLARMKRDA